MSEAVRSYSDVTGASLRRRRKGFWRRALIAALVVIIGTAWWVTRDTHAVWQVVPANHKAGIVFTDVNAQRARLADAAFWPLLPAEWGLDEVPDQLRSDFGLPPWVLNNLIGDVSYLFADDLEGLSDPCFVTRMSRFGTAMERLSRLARVTQRDHAGGLRMRSVPGTDLHYAVRGRLFIASPTREALVRALTLPDEAIWSRAEFQAAVEASREADLRIALRPDARDAAAAYAQAADIAVRFQPLGLEVSARVEPSREVATRLQPLAASLGNQPARALPAPPPGIIEIAANFGDTFAGTISALADVAGLDTPNARTWAAWAEAVHEAEDLAGLPDVPQMIAHLLGPAGPGIAISVTGVDPHEVAPVPILEAALDPQRVDPAAWFATLDPAVLAIDGWERVPQLDEARGLVFCRTIGGDSLTPAVARIGDRLYASTNLAHARAAVDAGGPIGRPLDSTGNLFMRIEPGPCVAALAALVMPIAEVGGIRGHDGASWTALMGDWQDYAARIDESTLVAALADGAIEASLRIAFAPVATTPEIAEP